MPRATPWSAAGELISSSVVRRVAHTARQFFEFASLTRDADSTIKKDGCSHGRRKTEISLIAAYIPYFGPAAMFDSTLVNPAGTSKTDGGTGSAEKLVFCTVMVISAALAAWLPPAAVVPVTGVAAATGVGGATDFVRRKTFSAELVRAEPKTPSLLDSLAAV